MFAVVNTPSTKQSLTLAGVQITQCEHMRAFMGLDRTSLDQTHLQHIDVGGENALDTALLTRSIDITWAHIGRLRLIACRNSVDEIWVFIRLALQGSSSYCLTCQSSRHCHHFPRDQAESHDSDSDQAQAATASAARYEEVRVEWESLFDASDTIKIKSWSQQPFPMGSYTSEQSKAIMYRLDWIKTRLSRELDETNGSVSFHIKKNPELITILFTRLCFYYPNRCTFGMFSRTTATLSLPWYFS
jgi:hypothetical protein